LFAAMRRALVLAGVVLAGLLAMVPALARPRLLSRPKKNSSDDSVKAKFGDLGELNFGSGPKDGVPKCLGELTFTGSFTFTGENEYVNFEADRARGSTFGSAKKGCRGARRPVAARRAVEAGGEEEAALLIHTPRPFPVRSMLVVEGEKDHHRIVAFSAFEQETTEGMRIARGAQALGGGSSFTWNLKAGTAHVDPQRRSPARDLRTPSRRQATVERLVAGAAARWAAVPARGERFSGTADRRLAARLSPSRGGDRYRAGAWPPRTQRS
jgi:hypothetical protein